MVYCKGCLESKNCRSKRREDRGHKWGITLSRHLEIILQPRPAPHDSSQSRISNFIEGAWAQVQVHSFATHTAINDSDIDTAIRIHSRIVPYDAYLPATQRVLVWIGTRRRGVIKQVRYSADRLRVLSIHPTCAHANTVVCELAGLNASFRGEREVGTIRLCQLNSEAYSFRKIYAECFL